EAEPRYPSACGGGGTSGQHTVPGRRRYAASAGLVPHLLQFRAAPQELTPGAARVRADQRGGLSQAVAAVHASDGGQINRACVDAQRSADVSGTTVAATSCRVKSGWGDDREARQDGCACDQSTGLQEAPKNRMRGLMTG